MKAWLLLWQGGWTEGPDLSYYDSEALMKRKGRICSDDLWKGICADVRHRSAEALLAIWTGVGGIKEMSAERQDAKTG
jgi:hypothetical protein